MALRPPLARGLPFRLLLPTDYGWVHCQSQRGDNQIRAIVLIPTSLPPSSNPFFARLKRRPLARNGTSSTAFTKLTHRRGLLRICKKT